MIPMLASVNSLEEALLIQQFDVDIIDLKQPALGALGALPLHVVKTIVSRVANTHTISATVGDLPMQDEIIFNAVKEMADTGVDYIKIGFFPGQNWAPVIDKLATLTQGHLRLIAVLFADQHPDFSYIEQFSQANFTGIMLDTMNKTQGSLTEVMPLKSIQNFVQTAQQHQLLCGLAGSLRITDIATLIPLNAEYLGFRGALCEHRQRTAMLDPTAIQKITNAMTLVKQQKAQ